MERQKIYFQLMGAFDYHQEDVGSGDRDLFQRGKKILSFLQYLIVNHSGSLTSKELMDRFWGDGRSNNPGSVLRYTISRTRHLLGQMFPGYDNLLLTVPGGFAWNPEVELILDSEQFEQIYMKAKHMEGDAQIGAFLEALHLYQDDFLTENEDEWVLPIRVYYRTLYDDACREVLSMLEEQERWMEIMQICQPAYQRDPASEEIISYLMKAYIALGYPELAVEQYQIFYDLLQREYEIAPSEQITQIYIRASGAEKGRLEKKDILALVRGNQERKKAYKCSFSVFQNITELELRHLQRSRQESCLMLAKIARSPSMTTDVRRLERVLLEGLRAGDSVAMLDQTSYVVLLPGATEETAQIVVERLRNNFVRLYSHSRARIHYDIFSLTADDTQGGY